jgi:hypothetical protein
MRKIILAALLLLAPITASAQDCTCSQARTPEQVFADPAISVVDVTVRGYNMHNGQSMLQIDNLRHGGLIAHDIRAHFSAQCGVVPNQPRMTLLIRNEPDVTYGIVDHCESDPVINSLQGQ